jgi:hypothetical protein
VITKLNNARADLHSIATEQNELGRVVTRFDTPDAAKRFADPVAHGVDDRDCRPNPAGI